MKRVARILIIGVAFGAIMLLVQAGLGLETPQTLQLMVVIAIVAALVAIGINLIYNHHYSNAMHRLMPLLDQDKGEEYVEGVENLLKTAKGQNLRHILQVNLSGGYMDTGRFEDAWNLLSGISGEKFSTSELLFCQRLNWCLSGFYTEHIDEALRILEENRSVFHTWQSRPSYGGPVAVAEVMEAYYKGENEKASQLLEAAREKWTDPRVQDSLDDVEDMLRYDAEPDETPDGDPSSAPDAGDSPEAPAETEQPQDPADNPT